ncbi:MAG: tetratricopeptide repeat protein [Blastocatellia bacterium]
MVQANGIQLASIDAGALYPGSTAPLIKNNGAAFGRECVTMYLRTGRIFTITISVAILIGLLLVYSVAAQSRNKYAVEQLKTAIELKKKGDSIGAEAHYREAIRLDPDYAEAHYSYAILLADRGDINAAISESKKAIDIEKNYAEAHFNLALLLRKKNDKDGEIKEYERAIAAAPSYLSAHFNLANALVERGNYEAAIEHYQHYLRLAPKAKDADQVRQTIKKLQSQL